MTRGRGGGRHSHDHGHQVTVTSYLTALPATVYPPCLLSRINGRRRLDQLPRHDHCAPRMSSFSRLMTMMTMMGNAWKNFEGRVI